MGRTILLSLYLLYEIYLAENMMGSKNSSRLYTFIFIENNDFLTILAVKWSSNLYFANKSYINFRRFYFAYIISQSIFLYRMAYKIT